MVDIFAGEFASLRENLFFQINFSDFRTTLTGEFPTERAHKWLSDLPLVFIKVSGQLKRPLVKIHVQIQHRHSRKIVFFVIVEFCSSLAFFFSPLGSTFYLLFILVDQVQTGFQVFSRLPGVIV